MPGRSREEQVEVCPQGWHDSYQRQGLPLRQMHWVSATMRVKHSMMTDYCTSSEFEW